MTASDWPVSWRYCIFIWTHFASTIHDVWIVPKLDHPQLDSNWEDAMNKADQLRFWIYDTFCDPGLQLSCREQGLALIERRIRIASKPYRRTSPDVLANKRRWDTVQLWERMYYEELRIWKMLQKIGRHSNGRRSCDIYRYLVTERQGHGGARSQEHERRDDVGDEIGSNRRRNRRRNRRPERIRNRRPDKVDIGDPTGVT